MMKNKKLILFRRLIIWLIYICSGFILYSKNGSLNPFLIVFARINYLLSIFWLQIRIKRRNTFLQIDSSMTTSQLWFNILPVISSLLTVVICFTNAFLYIFKYLLRTS